MSKRTPSTSHTAPADHLTDADQATLEAALDARQQARQTYEQVRQMAKQAEAAVLRDEGAVDFVQDQLGKRYGLQDGDRINRDGTIVHVVPPTRTKDRAPAGTASATEDAPRPPKRAERRRQAREQVKAASAPPPPADTEAA